MIDSLPSSPRHVFSALRCASRVCAVLAVLGLFAPSGAVAGELPKEWQTLSSATARLHYRKHVPSNSLRSKANDDCLALIKHPNEAVRAAAAEIHPLLKEVNELELAKLNSGMSPRNQAATRDMAVLGMLLGGDVDKTLGETMGKQAKSATDYARANQKLGELEYKRVAVWKERVRPVVIDNAGAEAAGAVNVQFGLLSRDVWISLQNVSPQDLHCCTLSTVTHQTDKPDLAGVWFVPELKKGEIIVIEPFHSWGMPALGKEYDLQKESLTVDFSFWSNESRVSQGKARSVDGYKIRDPFVENLVSPGRIYETTDGANPSRLRFTSMRRAGTGSGQAKFVVESDDGKKKEKYAGTWDEDRKKFSNFHPGGLRLTIHPDGATPAAQPKGKKTGPVRPQPVKTSLLLWIDGRFSTTGLFGIGNDFSPVDAEDKTE